MRKVFYSTLTFVLLLNCCSSGSKKSNNESAKQTPDLNIIEDTVNNLTKESDSIDYDMLVKKLLNSYENLKNSPDSKKYQLNFYDYFPNDWKTFMIFFGSDTAYSKFLENDYKMYFDKIRLFFNRLNHISNKKIIEKAINIGVNGKWEADGVNIFQHGLKPFVKDNLDLCFRNLNKRKAEEVKSFFYFFFDGPHPPENTPEEFEKMKDEYSQVYKLMKEGHQKVLDETDEHGH